MDENQKKSIPLIHSKSEENIPEIKLNKKEEKINNYILYETIGEGAFAKVKLAIHIPTKEKVAIKIITKDNTNLNKISKEIKILKRIRHINIIQIYEIIETESNIYIIMEYCENGDLFSLIKSKRNLTEIEACKYFQQIINGVEHIHLSYITHRDLKPENILLTDNNTRIVITDFAMSIISDEYNSDLSTICGTPVYSPPEMLKGKKYNGLYSDIWSCGVILYFMLVGNLPTKEKEEEEGNYIYDNIRTHNYYFPENLSSDVIDLLEHLLKVDPNERFNFDEIKAHPWFNLVNPKLFPGIQPSVQRIPIDPKILNEAKNMGYNTQLIEDSVIKSEYDEYNAVYYLILKQFKRKGVYSVSDLYSQDFINYLKNYKNWIDPNKINDPLYKNYSIDLPNDTFEDIEGKNFEKYINSDNLINDMEIKFDNINILDSLDNILEEKGNKMQMKKKAFYRNKKLKNLKELVSLNSTDNEDNSKIKKEYESKRYSNSNSNFRIQVNKKQREKIILLNEELSEKDKEKILSKLKEEETKFNEELNIISQNQKWNNSSYYNNIIKIIAEKLIHTTIFNKYLTHNKKSNSKSFLENKFYILQKYKSIIGLIERMRNKIFTKKLNDFNFYTFNEYLNDENDKIFVKYLIDIPYFNKFIQQAKDTFYKKDLLDKRTFSKYFDRKNNNNNLYNNNNNMLYSSYSKYIFNTNKSNSRIKAFTPNRNLKYQNLKMRYTNSINRYDINNYKNTPYTYKNLLKTPKSSRYFNTYQSKKKYKTYKSAGRLKQINKPFNILKKTNNKSKGSDSSYSNNSRNKNEKMVLITENEKYYIDTEIYANNISNINKNKNIISTSKKTKANISNKIYHSPRPNYNKSIAISPYKSNKKISVQLLSERKEKQKNIRIENNTQKSSLKEINEFTPINLNSISINMPISRIIFKAKKYLIKKGYFCSNKINEYYL